MTTTNGGMPPPRPRRPALVLADPQDLPESWRRRGRTLVLVALSARELADLLRDDPGPGRDASGELMGLVAEGHTQQAIARRLGCSLRTVQRRVARIRDELGVGTTQDLAAELVRRGLA